MPRRPKFMVLGEVENMACLSKMRLTQSYLKLIGCNPPDVPSASSYTVRLSEYL